MARKKTGMPRAKASNVTRKAKRAQEPSEAELRQQVGGYLIDPLTGRGILVSRLTACRYSRFFASLGR